MLHGGYVVAAWLGGIIVNLLTHTPPRFYDIALRDLGLALGALTMARLATRFEVWPQATEEPREGTARRPDTAEAPAPQPGPGPYGAETTVGGR